jgi:hypothetical protein
MAEYRRGYRRVIARWLTEESDLDELEDAVVDQVFLREAKLIQARTHLTRNPDAHAREVAKEFGLKRMDVHGLRMDLQRYGELEVVDS